MCMFDVDPCDFYDVSHPCSRKASRCDVCHAPIAKGEQYERHSYVYDGTARSDRACACCAVSLLAFKRHHGQAPTPDWFADALHDCFDGATKTDPDVKMWRDIYAGIVKRERAARRSA